MREVKLKTPLSEKDVRALEVGVRVLLSGQVLTARDRAHRYLVEEAAPTELPFDLSGAVVYHCGPVTRKRDDGTWELIAAGPTTSARMQSYVPALVKTFGVRAVIGKGGLDAEVLSTFEASGAVYLSAVGGAAQVLARAVTRIERCWKVDAFGTPEGLWLLRVEDFPTVVTMDAHGRSLHDEVAATSRCALGSLLDIM